MFAELEVENSYTQTGNVCINFRRYYCLPICVNRQMILKVAVVPFASVAVISVLPEPPAQMATGKAALYVLLGSPFSMTSTWMKWKVKISERYHGSYMNYGGCGQYKKIPPADLAGGICN